MQWETPLVTRQLLHNIDYDINNDSISGITRLTQLKYRMVSAWGMWPMWEPDGSYAYTATCIDIAMLLQFKLDDQIT